MSQKLRAILVGVFILVAYGVLASGVTNSKPIILFADVISGLAVIGIATLMYPLFKNVSRIESVSYLFLKFIEGLLMISAGIFYTIDPYQHLRNYIYNGVHLHVFIISGFLFYHLLLRSKLIPKFISIWGIVAITVLALTTIAELLRIDVTILKFLLVLIITNEIFLSIWLFIKGFRK